MKYAIFGDLSGWREPFKNGLATVGVDLDGDVIPDDLVVIQVGDVIRKGPDSEALMADVDRLQRQNPYQWFQLVGNHEACYLGGPLFGHWTVSLETVRILQKMLDEQRLLLGKAINTKEHGEVLITHAGMPPNVWDLFDRPMDAETTADRLNALLWSPEPIHRQLAFHPGQMLSGTHRDVPGVVWAEPVHELWEAWRLHDEDMPFTQIHGHASAYRWGKKKFNDERTTNHYITSLDAKLRQLTVAIGKKKIISIDPGYGQYDPGRPLLPLILEAAD